MTEIRERLVPDVATVPSPLALELEGFLPYQLNCLATEVSQSLARIYGERFNVSIPEWRVLATLGQFGNTTAREIGRHSRMHKTTVSRALAALEKRRLVTRRTNRDDMREAFVALSEEGQGIYLRIVPLARDFAERLCVDLDGEERAALRLLLEKLSGRVLAMQGAED